jgi:hypothetical protein
VREPWHLDLWMGEGMGLDGFPHQQLAVLAARRGSSGGVAASPTSLVAEDHPAPARVNRDASHFAGGRSPHLQGLVAECLSAPADVAGRKLSRCAHGGAVGHRGRKVHLPCEVDPAHVSMARQEAPILNAERHG